MLAIHCPAPVSRLIHVFRGSVKPGSSIRGLQRAISTQGDGGGGSGDGGQQRWRRTVATASGAMPAAGAGSPGASPALLIEGLAIPPAPGFRSLGARVEHLLAPRDGLLSAVLTEVLGLPEGVGQLLVRFGAVHSCPVPPASPPAVLAAMSPERAAEVTRNRQEALQRAGSNTQARMPQRALQDREVSRHTYIRVHLHPKRFPAAYSVDWAERVVACTADFVVVSKPAGVPAAPTVDNLLECAPTCTAQALGHSQPLRITHRLDQCTEGLLVLGRSKAFVAAFNELVQRSSSNSNGSGGSTGSSSSDGSGTAVAEGQSASAGAGANAASASSALRPLRKFYRAATAAAPPLGLLRHHLSIEQRQQGLPAFTIAHEQAVEGSLRAELRVLKAQPIRLTEAAAAQWGVSASSTASCHECLIELLTGRTHQIRAQLSAVACPLLGDSLYQPLASPELRQRLFSGDGCEELVVEGPGDDRLLSEPAGGIGLQACRLLVTDACMGGSLGEPAVFEAGAPWWRLEVLGGEG